MPLWTWQKLALLAAPTLLAAGAFLAPRTTLSALLALLAFPFFCVVLLRAAALWHAAPFRAQNDPAAKLGDPDPEDLPRYTILVPLFREAAIVPDLIEALGRLDYPAAKLEIFLIAEEIDHETQAALRRHRLKDWMHIVVVPDGAPRTKPRALNYALAGATGDYVVVYDAEDMPEPDQLKKAIAALTARPGIGCAQSRLNIYNARETWLTRQFTIEYTALFDRMLPALERLRLPVPLGGTSNHFPRRVLLEVGGWDPFNVTEDADLGIRLARAGWSVVLLDSTTWEEAPPGLRVWLGQRTRWLKGWMQTYLVHMREPRRLVRELGLRGSIGLQVLMGGLILSALIHPWFLLIAAVDAHDLHMGPPDSLAGNFLWWVGLFNLVAGYAAGVALGAVAVSKRGMQGLASYALIVPIYWLLISVAAYRALAQLAVAPYFWEKTEHSSRSAKSPGEADCAECAQHPEK